MALMRATERRLSSYGVQRVQKVQRVQRVQVRCFASIFIKGDALRLEDRSQVSDVSQSNSQSLIPSYLSLRVPVAASPHVR